MTGWALKQDASASLYLGLLNSSYDCLYDMLYVMTQKYLPMTSPVPVGSLGSDTQR